MKLTASEEYALSNFFTFIEEKENLKRKDSGFAQEEFSWKRENSEI